MMRYLIEQCEHRSYTKNIHVEEPLFSGWFGPDYKFSDYEKLSEKNREFVDEIIAIPGVKRLYCGPYLCSVEKGGVFDWDEITPKVIEVLQRKYGGSE